MCWLLLPALLLLALSGRVAAADEGPAKSDAAYSLREMREAVDRYDGLNVHALIGGEGSIPGGTDALGQSTSAMSLMFERPDVFPGIGVAIRYVNEGFLGPQNQPWPLTLSSPLHYRDAFGVLFDRWFAFNDSCRVAPALGLETYFDTTATSFRWNYRDQHGLGLESSLAGQCRLTHRFSLEMMVTRSFDAGSFDSTTVVFGLVFAAGQPQDLDGSAETRDEVRNGRLEIAAGRLDLDDFDESRDDGTVTWISYDRSLTGAFGLDVSLLREHVDGGLDRRGGALLATAQHQLFTRRLQAFFGAGPYLARTRDYADQTSSTKLNFLLEYGFRVAVGRHFSLSAKLGRVAAGAGRNDSDLIMLGIACEVP